MPIGRPPKTPEEKRSKRLAAYFTRKEYTAVQTLSAGMGVTPGTLLRMLIIHNLTITLASKET